MHIKKQTFILAAAIAVFPPLWAVAAPYLGIKTGAVALICAGVYAANGNKREDALKITAGFWCGDFWACLALWILKNLKLGENVGLFLSLAVLGFAAVLIASVLDRYIYLPSWLCGWAIGLSLMTPETLSMDKTIPFQIGVAMAVGVWYVGAGVDFFCKLVEKKLHKKENKNGSRI
ncbi:DUF1097 domain-containing protein [Novisyntrophococcus fermenticellae]|uniref:DUF1097 domain-containing protein n=1 Tax=Novisyntrophococcus fermenticellae TaxID=2068655 RepID=UPI001E3739D1|nr:DUF1097 domain-containing protein [Novisyntrophococcus fermenticellae]